MGRSTRAVPRERMSQKRLDSLIINPAVNREHVDPRPVLTGHEEYDTLHPEETFKAFCASIRQMLAKYDSDKEELAAAEAQMQDLLHFIEMTKDKNANAGYKLYKQLCEVRRHRRRLKNEIDLLQPVYDAFHETSFLTRLTDIQGRCGSVKQIINNKGYTVRTDILEGLFD